MARTKATTVLLSEEELEIIRKNAREENLPVATFIRNAAMKATGAK